SRSPTSSDGHGCATGRSTCSGSCPRRRTPSWKPPVHERRAVNPALAGVALAVVLGAVVAVSARNARTAVLGLVLSLIGGAFLADPLPDSTGLAARLIGTVLGGYLLWIAARGVDARTGGSRLGWPVELLIAAAAAVVGYGSHGLGAPALGPALAQAAGLG